MLPFSMEKQFNNLEKLSVLIAEDDLVFSLILRTILKELGFHVYRIVQTEDEVVSSSNSLSPDLIILDVHLKQGNGILARKRISEFSDKPILMLTGSSPNAVPDLVGIDYLIKPFLINDLKTKILQMLNLNQQHANF